jgi:hypothetical protein
MPLRPACHIREAAVTRGAGKGREGEARRERRGWKRRREEERRGEVRAR